MLAPLTTTAATVITTLELKEASHLTRFMKSTELFGEPSFQTKTLTLGCVPGLILLMVQSKGPGSGTLAKAAEASLHDSTL